MSKYAWRTTKIIVGTVLVAWVAVSSVYMAASQLSQTSYHPIAILIGTAIGWLVVLVFAIWLIARNGTTKRQ